VTGVVDLAAARKANGNGKHVPPPKSHKPRSATPPQSDGSGGANPLQIREPFTDEKHVGPVWDALCKSCPAVTAHICGEQINHGAYDLPTVVRLFHEANQAHAMYPHQLVGILLHEFPQRGAYHGTNRDLLDEQVKLHWARRTEEINEDSTKLQEEAKAREGWLTISDEPWDPDTLPPRPWLAPPYLMRGEILLLHGPGGGGKSQLIIHDAVALALGKKYGRLQPRQRCRVLLTNFEDNADEQKRRISAALRFFGATPADLVGWLFRVSLGPKGDATMFALDGHGAVVPTQCWHALVHACEMRRPDAVFLDPLVAINAVPESDNTLMRRVMTFLLMGVSRRFNCALGIAHHDNKNGAEDDDGDQGNARGAGDIVNAVRFEKAVKTMTAKQAEQMIPDASRRGFYFRLGSVASKVNYAAPEESEWFERLAVVINGEQVVRCFPWDPPSTRLTEEMAASLIAAIGQGTKHGPYSPQLGKGDRSLSPMLDEIGIKGTAPQRRAMHELKDRHGVVQVAWKVPRRGDVSRAGLRTADGRPDYAWLDDEGIGP
jgi:hypothetical protein